MLQARIALLQAGGVISPPIGEFVRHAVCLLQKHFPHVTENGAASFITHLAMATERLNAGQFVPPLTDEAWAQVTSDTAFPAAEKFLAALNQISPVHFPPNERQYLLLYLCTMLKK